MRILKLALQVFFTCAFGFGLWAWCACNRIHPKLKNPFIRTNLHPNIPNVWRIWQTFTIWSANMANIRQNLGYDSKIVLILIPTFESEAESKCFRINQIPMAISSWYKRLAIVCYCYMFEIVLLQNNPPKLFRTPLVTQFGVSGNFSSSFF